MDADLNSKKVSLEDLPKDELIKKCKGLLNILQKAKQSKEILIEENNNLKEKVKTSETDSEMLESLIQQKVQLVTSLEEIKSQKKVLENKLKDCEYNLTSATDKNVILDNENQGCRRQIERLIEENEQLLSRLDSLECETKELKDKAIQESNIAEKISNYDSLNSRFEQFEEIHNQVKSSNNELSARNKELLEKCEALTENITTLQNDSSTTATIVADLKTTIQEKIDENNEFQNVIFKLKTDLQEQMFLIEQLKSEPISNDTSNSTSDLQDVNDKLKDKLKLFHSKLVKFATDVKFLKQEKNNVLINFKEYVNQVQLWEEKLKEFSTRVIEQYGQFENEKSQVTLEYDSLKIEFDSIEKENSTLNCHNKELSEAIEILKSKVDNKQSEKLDCDNKMLTERLNNVIKEIDEFKVEIESLKCQRNLLQEQYQNLVSEKQQLESKNQSEITKLEEKIQSFEKNHSFLVHELEQKVIDVESLTTENKTLRRNVKEFSHDRPGLFAEIDKLTEDNKMLSELLERLQTKLVETKQESTSQQQQLQLLKNENTELLEEMNEMNQVLKERGETISKQQEYCEELLKNVKLHESQSKKYMELSNEKDCMIKRLEENYNVLKDNSSNRVVSVDNATQATVSTKEDEEILLLQNEITSLKEKLLHIQDTSQDTCYAESETLSTSTISRADDVNRLKDLEGSWEERYGKLRSLALKQKRKIHEITDQLTKEQTEKNELQQKLTLSHKTIQTLQSQCDSIQDDLDKNKSDAKDYSKKLDLAASNKSTYLQKLADHEELISKLQSEIEALDKEKTSTDLWKKQVSSKVQNLKRELDANLLVKNELENQIKKLNTDLDGKSKLLNDEIEKHNATKNQLLESHNECKKQSVLNLEIQDYERSTREFTQKLDKKQETIIKLKNQIDQQNSTLNSLKEQNRLLEERIQNEEEHLSGTRNELQTYKKRTSDLEAITIEKDDKLLNLTHSLENSRVEIEELSTHLSKVVADNQKICDSLKSDKQLLHSQNSHLETNIREANDTVRLREEEITDIRKEYESYKVRAQSVLRSSQVRDVGLEEKLTEEIASFRARVDVLMREITDLRALSENVKDENSKLMLEKETTESKWREIESALGEQKHQYDLLSVKHQKTIIENSEAISSLKVHADTLSQCYRQQLSDQETRHNKEVIELQSKFEKVTPVLDTAPLIPPLTPREQGEGSECVDSPSSIKFNHPLPLDKLLNSEMEHDIGFLRKQISEHETKVTYLTSLLADTEQDLVKHVQMNKLLKEEIRRYQRSEEREKHAENLEYLKNIVFKFATLTNGDERSRLVPVLNTILKFSPDETNQLNLVARGEVTGRAWSDYLPIWSSGKPL